MKINRKDIYRVKVGAVYSINSYGTKTKSDNLNTYYCVPVYNSRRIIGFKELLSDKELVKRVYEDNECCDDFYKDKYYPYAYDKTREFIQIGDIDVEIDQDYETEELQKYVNFNKDAVAESIDSLELNAIRQTCEGYDPKRTMEYYNKELYLCPLDDDFIVVKPCCMFGIITGFRELITGRKVIKRTSEELEYDYLINMNRKLVNLKIEPIDFSVLATRGLKVSEFEDYMDLTPEEVEAKIANHLAKKSRERGLDYQPKFN